MALAEKFRINPVIARLIRNRDVIGDEKIQEYLHGTLADLPSGRKMKDLEKAAEILENEDAGRM